MSYKPIMPTVFKYVPESSSLPYGESCLEENTRLRMFHVASQINFTSSVWYDFSLKMKAFDEGQIWNLFWNGQGKNMKSYVSGTDTFETLLLYHGSGFAKIIPPGVHKAAILSVGFALGSSAAGLARHLPTWLTKKYVSLMAARSQTVFFRYEISSAWAG